MTIQPHQPWKPTCWVGGVYLGSQGAIMVRDPWVWMPGIELETLEDDSRAKYAATKATAAILRSMRK